MTILKAFATALLIMLAVLLVGSAVIHGTYAMQGDRWGAVFVICLTHLTALVIVGRFVLDLWSKD